MTRRRLAALALLGLLSPIAQPSASAQNVVVGPIVNPANGNRYYRLSPANVSAQRNAALAMGGDLVTINDAAENTWIFNNILRAGGNNSPCYLGLNDVDVVLTFRWFSGQALTYTNWTTGEPNNFGDSERYVVMLAENGTWNDYPGFISQPAIVEVTGPIRVPQEYATISGAIAAAIDGQTILVSPGTYTEVVDFQYKRLVIRSTGGPLSTTIVGTGNPAVIMNGGQGRETVLDGFTCKTTGGSTIGSLVIGNSQIARNCVVPAGSARNGVYIQGSALVDGCVIAGWPSGGAAVRAVIALPNSTPQIQNCTIVGNNAAIGMSGGRPETRMTVANSIVQFNTVPASIDGGPSGGTIAASYCNYQDGFAGQNMINADPMFIDGMGPDGIWGTADDDYRLRPGSPCIDAGSNAALLPTLGGIPLDLYGNSRFANDPGTADTGVGPGAIVDIGATEFQGSSITCPVDFNGDGVINADDIADFISAYFNGCS